MSLPALPIPTPFVLSVFLNNIIHMTVDSLLRAQKDLFRKVIQLTTLAIAPLIAVSSRKHVRSRLVLILMVLSAVNRRKLVRQRTE